MKTLYSGTILAQFQTRAKRCAGAILALAGLCLASCIYLCSCVRTGNAAALLVCVVALSTLAGWAAMCLLVFVYAPARAQSGHIAGILKEETAQHEGEIFLRREKLHIPQSIDICKVRLISGEEEIRLNVNARFAHELPPDGTRVRVTTARKFITAFEVAHEKE